MAIEPPGHPPPLWGNIIAGIATFIATAGFIGTIGNMRISPIDDHLGKIDAEISSINVLMAPLLTLKAQHESDQEVIVQLRKALDLKLNKDLFDEKVSSTEKEVEDNKNSTLRAAEEVTHQVHELEANIVSRNENQQHWNEFAAQMLDLKGQISALRLEVEGQKAAKP